MSNNLEKYLSGWSYKSNPIPLDKVGIFRVKGEDPNPDFGGSHYQPELGVFRGKFEDVASYAVEIPGFWRGWGSGGSIEEIVIKEITADSSKKRKALLAEQKDLKKKLKEIEESLGE